MDGVDIVMTSSNAEPRVVVNQLGGQVHQFRNQGYTVTRSVPAAVQNSSQ